MKNKNCVFPFQQLLVCQKLCSGKHWRAEENAEACLVSCPLAPGSQEVRAWLSFCLGLWCHIAASQAVREGGWAVGEWLVDVVAFFPSKPHPAAEHLGAVIRPEMWKWGVFPFHFPPGHSIWAHVNLSASLWKPVSLRGSTAPVATTPSPIYWGFLLVTALIGTSPALWRLCGMLVALISSAHPPRVAGSWGGPRATRPAVIRAPSVHTPHSSVSFATGDQEIC